MKQRRTRTGCQRMRVPPCSLWQTAAFKRAADTDRSCADEQEIQPPVRAERSRRGDLDPLLANGSASGASSVANGQRRVNGLAPCARVGGADSSGSLASGRASCSCVEANAEAGVVAGGKLTSGIATSSRSGSGSDRGRVRRAGELSAGHTDAGRGLAGRGAVLASVEEASLKLRVTASVEIASGGGEDGASCG